MALDHSRFKNEADAYFEDLSNFQNSAFELACCIFCGPTQDKIRLFFKGTMCVVRCKCGLIYNASQPTQQTLDDFYAGSAAMNTWAKLKSGPEEKIRQEEKFGRAVRRIAQDPNIKSVLDIGCGNGKFLAMLKEANPKLRLFGVDSNKSAVEAATAAGVPAKVMSIDEQINLGVSEWFDCITLWGVLEHVKDPMKVLRAAHEQLTPNGLLVVCVPNANSVAVRTLWERCYTFCPQHLWYFTPHTLGKATFKADFSFSGFHTIEPETLPTYRYSLGLDPYSQEPSWLTPEASELRMLSRQALENDQGYKIVFFANKLPNSGHPDIGNNAA